jgi:hypothetical protein
MTTIMLSLFATVLVFTCFVPQVAAPAPRLPLVKIGEWGMDLHPSGITTGSSIIIQRDGHFHLETRFQQLPSERVVRHVYESTLDAFQLSRLESMLDAQAVRDAPTYQGPKFPLTVPTVAGVTVKIPRGDKVQSVGYFAWNKVPGREDSPPETTPEAIKEEWRSSRVALTPLVGWFHEIEGMKWPELDESHFITYDDPDY